MRRYILAVITMVLWILPVTILSAGITWRFEKTADLQSWAFSNGPEYPGAIGSMATGVADGLGYLALNYDLNPAVQKPANFNPKYVSMSRDLPAEIGNNLARIEIEAAWSSPLLALTIQYLDTSGQTFQTQVYPAFESVGDAWLRFGTEIIPTKSYWGGAKDGVIHYPLRRITLLVAPPTYAPRQGWMRFKKIVLKGAAEVQPITLPLAQLRSPAGARKSLDKYLGVCVHDVQNFEDLEKVTDLGMTQVRTDLYWAVVERRPGKFDFTQYQGFLQKAKALKLSVNFILCYSNNLYAGDRVPPLSAKAITAYVQYAQAAVGVLGTDSVMYEVWNEPDGPSTWNGAPNPAEYARLLLATSSSLTKNIASPNVVSAGLTGPGSTAFIDAMRSSGALENCAGLGVHLYSGSQPESSSPAIIYCQAVARDETKGQGLYVTEWGYSSASFDPGKNGLSDSGRRLQACYLVRIALLSWWHGLDGLTLYDLRDDGRNSTDREHNFGLYDTAGVEKPSGTALRVLGKAAQGRTFSGMVVDSTVPPWLHIASLKGSSTVLYVFWSEATTFTNKLSIQLSGTRISDLLGREIANPSQKGTITIDLDSAKGPIYIEMPISEAPANVTIN